MHAEIGRFAIFWEFARWFSVGSQLEGTSCRLWSKRNVSINYGDFDVFLLHPSMQAGLIFRIRMGDRLESLKRFEKGRKCAAVERFPFRCEE